MLCRNILRSSVRYNSTVAGSVFPPPIPENNTQYDKFPPLETIDSSMLPTQQQSKAGWYFVPRSRAGKLPVYTEVKKSDNTVHTVITHTQGDVQSLRQDLRVYLGLEDKNRIVIKQASNKVVIKHNVAREVKAMLGQIF